MALRLDHEAVQELLGAYALDACEPDEAAAIEGHLVHCHVCSDEAFRLADAAGWLGATDAVAPPVRLRDPVLGITRPAVHAAPPRPPQVRLYAEQTAAVDRLLTSVRGDEWSAPIEAIPGWRVHDLAVHLAATEQRLACTLGTEDPYPDLATADVDTRTHALVERHRGAPPERVIGEWRSAADAVLRSVVPLDAEARRRPVDAYDVPIPLERVLVARSFELWVHGNDIHAALGRPPEHPSDEGMALLANAAVRSLPMAMRLTGRERPGRTAWVVLGGAGGGRWPLALGQGEEPGVPDVVIGADAVAFCLLAGDRLTPAEVGATVEGDEELGAEVLAAASAFARL